jgi:hypothetical protein
MQGYNESQQWFEYNMGSKDSARTKASQPQDVSSFGICVGQYPMKKK